MEELKPNPMGVFFGKVLELNNGFSKQNKPILDVILEEGKVPNKEINKVKFEVYNDKIPLFKDVKINDIIEIHYNIKGNLWRDKIFTNLHVNFITILEKSTPDHLKNIELPDNKDFSFEEFE